MNEIQLKEDMLIVTCVVESLYSSIKHKDGLKATQFFLMTSDTDPEFGELILKLLEFVLTDNLFLSKENFYLQMQGTAMGVVCAFICQPLPRMFGRGEFF